MMAMHYFKFAFPADTKALPNPCSYEVLPGNVGIIQTDDETLAGSLDQIAAKCVGEIMRTTSESIRSLIGTTKTIDQIDRIPSFTKQTKWDCGFFNTPDEPGKCYLNPSLELWNGSLHLFTRRCRYPTNLNSLSWRSCDNDLAIFRVFPNMELHDEIVPEPPKRWPREQWEDPRAFVFDGNLFVSMCTYINGISWRPRQAIAALSRDLSLFEVVNEPHWGGNHSTPSSATKPEKNWTWFTGEKGTYCIYQLHPLVVYGPGSEDKPDCTSLDSLPWTHGTLRGGTNPVAIDGEFLTFFHSSMPWKDAFGRCVMGHRRRYYMGAVTISAEPPFRITSITPEPLLVGSEEDPRKLEGPPVVFPCGAKLIENNWLVTMGINDESCGWISIPHEELKAKMVKV